jgi:hypothetical protein
VDPGDEGVAGGGMEGAAELGELQSVQAFHGLLRFAI